MARILDGITVLDLSTGPAAALATMFLGDHGARIVRIIDRGASPHRDGGYAVWDRGKECVALDLATASLDAPQSLYRQLVAGADVLVEDFAPSAPLQRLVDWCELASVNPRLVHCSITAYGKKGPLKDEPPIEDLVLARMGVLASLGHRPRLYSIS
jgi:crotonobetainyl-CoA:carnitine CoA-transferase CaiB-like acyl-CoA transferase